MHRVRQAASVEAMERRCENVEHRQRETWKMTRTLSLHLLPRTLERRVQSVSGWFRVRVDGVVSFCSVDTRMGTEMRLVFRVMPYT